MYWSALEDVSLGGVGGLLAGVVLTPKRAASCRLRSGVPGPKPPVVMSCCRAAATGSLVFT